MDTFMFDWTFHPFFTSPRGTTLLPRRISYSALTPSILMYSKMALLFPYSESLSVFFPFGSISKKCLSIWSSFIIMC